MAPKPLSEFPRPPEDNGRGIHWSATVYHPTGRDLQFWLNELKAMQIKWVKLLDDSGGSSIELCRALLDNGIMPIVRIYRQYPNPGHLDGRGVDAVRRLIDVGVRYFETNNEPDLPAEWKGGVKPPNWLDIVVDNFIWDADYILSLGGLPAFPAMGPGSKDNGIVRVIQRGRRDIFERGAWVAIHNYTLNHPLDYPDDPVNQHGQPLTPEEYEYYRRWQYSHLSPEEAAKYGVSRDEYFQFQNWAWDGWTMEMVNRERALKKNPGATVFDDPNCFRGYEVFGQMIYDALGFYVPVISTEAGPCVDWKPDTRYPRVSPTTHAEWQMAIYRFLQDEAPEWYFTSCTWLIGARPFNDFNPAWERMSWYTHIWDKQFGLNGQLPIVQILKDTPAQIRHELRRHTSAVEGRLTDAAGRPLAGHTLRLLRGNQVVATAQSDAEGRYRLTAAPGVYDLAVQWVGVVARSITLGEGDTDVIDIPHLEPAGAYTIGGTVRDTTGQTRSGVKVELRRQGLTHAETSTDAQGRYSFKPGVAGAYTVTAGEGGAQAVVSPDRPQATADVTIAAPVGLRYYLTEKRLLSKEETGNNRMFFGRVRDAQGRGMKGIELEMQWKNAAPGTVFPRTRTGQNPFRPDPDGYFEFLHSPGEFSIRVVQGDYPSDVADGLVTTGIPGREGDPITYEINFQLRAADAPPRRESVIAGTVPGGRVGQVVTLWQGQRKWEFALEADRRFRFDGLSAGVYDLALAGVGLVRQDIVLDGSNQVSLDFPLLGAIVGRVENPPPDRRRITLISETYGFSRHGELTSEGAYRFTNLPAGTYRLEMDDTLVSGLVGDGLSVLEVPPIRLGEATPPPSPPPTPPAAASRLSGSVRDATGRPQADVVVRLRRGAETVATTRTDGSGAYRFEGLAAGTYALAVDDRVLAADLVLDGTNALTVDLTYTPAAPTPPSARPLSRYYLLGLAEPALHPTLVRLMAGWLTTQPSGVVGFNAAEAAQATTVVLVGDGITDATVASLQAAGCQIVDLRRSLLALAATFAASR